MNHLKSIFSINNVLHFLFVDVGAFLIVFLLFSLLFPFDIVPRTDETVQEVEALEDVIEMESGVCACINHEHEENEVREAFRIYVVFCKAINDSCKRGEDAAPKR